MQNVQPVSISVRDGMRREHKQLSSRLFMSYFRVSIFYLFVAYQRLIQAHGYDVKTSERTSFAQDVLSSCLREGQMSRPIWKSVFRCFNFLRS
jgi:hypothetical protein